MEEKLKDAVIEPDGKIRCPFEWCKKCNGVANKGAVIKNYIVRCKASRRNHEHFFLVNWDGGKEEKND